MVHIAPGLYFRRYGGKTKHVSRTVKVEFQFQNWGPGISEDYASCGAPTKASDGDVKTNTGKERKKG